MDNNIKLGVSLFSMGYEYAADAMDLKECIRTAGALGYTGIELVSAQMVPGYPYPDGQWCDDISDLMRSFGVEPVAYGSYVDKARYSDHDLSEDEIYESVFNDMLIAARMGFGIVKVNDLIGVGVLRRLIPLARRLGLWIGVELHRPHTIRDEQWRGYFKLFAEDQGRHVGVVPDTGIFLSHPHEIFRREMVALGMTPSDYDMALKYFSRRDEMRGHPMENLPEMVRRCYHKMCEDFIPTSMEDFAVMLRYSRYMHGKFFYVDEALGDESIDFAAIVDVLKQCGFRGYICAEYEGYFHDISLSAVTQLDRYRRMMARYLQCAFETVSDSEISPQFLITKPHLK